jgi:DNA-binding response OmpR family regulator
VAIIAGSTRDQGPEKIKRSTSAPTTSFLCEPVKFGELVARARRLRACYARLSSRASEIDVVTRIGALRGRSPRFASKKFEAPHIPATANSRVVTRRQMIEFV